jgi:hypothetical protein
MNIDESYRKVLQELEQGHRALQRFSADEIEEFASLLETQNSPDELEKVLCLIEHAASPQPLLEGPLLKFLATKTSPNLIVFALNCARKHIVQSRQQRGQRLTYEFLEVLKKLLHSPEPEVVEWTLRTIEECGSQGVYFLREFDKIKPPPWKWFNQHQRSVRELIAMLERRWGQFEAPKS